MDYSRRYRGRHNFRKNSHCHKPCRPTKQKTFYQSLDRKLKTCPNQPPEMVRRRRSRKSEVNVRKPHFSSSSLSPLVSYPYADAQDIRWLLLASVCPNAAKGIDNNSASIHWRQALRNITVNNLAYVCGILDEAPSRPIELATKSIENTTLNSYRSAFASLAHICR